MKAALIATVFNEADSVGSWLEALDGQSRAPDEIVIVDGGSTDQTPSRIADFFASNERFRGNARLIRKNCNIAEGRNIAIDSAVSDIVICTDAGSMPDPAWFGKMSEPFERGAQLVAGWTESNPGNEFQKKLKAYSESDLSRTETTDYLPSSRTIGFRKSVWKAVGGYPEWMTLAGEDALFNMNLKAAGFEFVVNKNAIVYWDPRPTLGGFLKQLYSYGYGAAEAKLYRGIHFRRLLTTLFPPLILFSKNPIRDVPFRFMRNAASAFGWIAGTFAGHKPPAGWKVVDGILLSPETQSFRLTRTSSAPVSASST